MKIALLAPANDIHTVRWVNALNARGHEVHLISMHPRKSGIDAGVFLHKLHFSPPHGYYLNKKRLIGLMGRIKPDLLNTHYISGYGTLARLCGFYPCILSAWGSDVFDFPEKSFIHRRLIRKNLRFANHIFSTSYAMAQRIFSLEQSISDVHITPFGVNTKSFRADIREKKKEELVIGTVKKLEFKYGIDILLRAFAGAADILRGINPKSAAALRLLIAGEGPDRQFLESLASKLGISGQVTFIGPVEHDQVPLVLNRLDVFAALSRSESFGVSVIEASACGLPVIVSNAGGLPEVVRQDETGIIVPAEDPQAAAEAMVSLVRDSSLRRIMGCGGREFVRGNYEWDECVRIMEEGYLSVADAPPE